jgi:hypothetical protein
METTNNGEISTRALRELIASEDKRYEQRFIDIKTATEAAYVSQKTAMEAAFAAQKTAMEAAFAAAEKVSQKTEKGHEESVKSINILLEQLRVQAMTFIPRQEWAITVNNFSDSIKKLEDYHSQLIGAENYGSKSKSQNNWIIGVIISALAIGVSMVAVFLHH